MTWIETLILTLIHPSHVLTLIHPCLSHISISISIYNISICLYVVKAYPCNPSHPLALTRCKPSYIDQPCGSAKHSRTMTNDCDRSHSVMSRHNYMRKRNWQLSWFSMESQTVLLDSRRCTMVKQDALWWNWMSQAKMRAPTSLRQFCLTHAHALHVQSQCWDSSGCNTRIKVKHQITKRLTKVLSQAKNRPGPPPGWGNHPIPSKHYRSMLWRTNRTQACN